MSSPVSERTPSQHHSLGGVPGWIVGAFGEVVEQKRHYATLLAVPERLEGDRTSGGQPLHELKRLPRRLREQRPLSGSVMVLGLELDLLTRLHISRAQSVGHHADGDPVLNIAGHSRLGQSPRWGSYVKVKSRNGSGGM